MRTCAQIDQYYLLYLDYTCSKLMVKSITEPFCHITYSMHVDPTTKTYLANTLFLAAKRMIVNLRNNSKSIAIGQLKVTSTDQEICSSCNRGAIDICNHKIYFCPFYLSTDCHLYKPS